MLNLKQVLAADIAEGIAAAQKAGDLPQAKSLPNVVVEHPEQKGQGDYASPIALALTKLMKKPPVEIVEVLARHMPKKEYIGKMEAASPGFLNIWINPVWLGARVDDVIEQDPFLETNVGQGKAVNLEFISANPTGPLTLGNARTAFSADTLANVLKAVGYNVTREYYINDAGGQVKRLGESVLRRIVQQQPFDKAQGKGKEIDFPEDLYQGEYIKDIAQVIAERWQETEGRKFAVSDVENEEIVAKVSEEAMRLCLASIKKTIQEDLHIAFDVWTSERAIRQSGIIEACLEKLRKEGLTYTKDGAEFLKTTQFGDSENRVLVKKDGEYAYIAPDIGYHQSKYDREFDLMFTFLGADHQGHVPKLKAAMEALGNDPDKLHFPIAQWLTLVRKGKPVKLSKRKGEVYGPQDLIKEISYDAARYFMVQYNLSSHMELDLSLASERSERNPVYYVQYAYVRLQSILRKVKEQGIITEVDTVPQTEEQVTVGDEATADLLKTMYRLPEVLTDIGRTFEVHTLAFYAYDLARATHGYYNLVPVLTADNAFDLMDRLRVVFAAQKVLGTVLDLLGVSKPEVM